MLKDVPGYENLYAVTETGQVWSYRSEKYLSQSLSRDGYPRVLLCGKEKKKLAEVHRLMGITFLGIKPREELDHEDLDKTNNNLVNLRPATRVQNMRNRKVMRGTCSGLKGVSWHKGHHRWSARIKVNRKGTHLGYFDTKEEAFKAYREASEKYHGNFARA